MMKIDYHLARRLGLLIAGALLSLLVPGLHAQEPATPLQEETRTLVGEVRFEGNTFFEDERLRAQVHTTPNRRFLGIPGFTWWRWVYQMGTTSMLGETLSEALMRSGEAPAVLDPAGLEADVERLRLFYRQEGFRKAQTQVHVDTLANGQKARVTFRLRPGSATYVRKIQFDGVRSLTIEQQHRLVENSLLHPPDDLLASDDTVAHSFHPNDLRYSEPLLHEERQRVLTFLRDVGYPTTTRDSIRALVFSPEGAEAAPDSFDITFRIRPGRRHRFGNVHATVSGPEPGAAPRRDTIRFPATEATSTGRLVVHIADESKLDPGLIRRALQFRPGAWYDQSALRATKRRLEATGVFSFTNIQPEADSLAARSETPHYPLRFTLRTRPRHQLRLETFMLQRSGVDLSTTDNELGTGLGVTYTNANLFGGGETFRLRTTGSFAVDARSRLFTSAQAEIGASLTYPYLVAPFGRLDPLLRLYEARTQFSLSLLTARRDALNLVIRGRGNARLRLDMQHTPTLASFVDVLDISLSNPDTLRGFRGNFLSRIIGPTDGLLVPDPVQRAQLLEDYTRPQINNAFRYTFRATNANPLRRARGYSYETSVEVGGHLPYLLDRFAFSPDTLEGTLPGLPFFAGRRTSRLRYRRYLRAVGDVRRYYPLSRHTVLAGRFLAGWAHPLGKARVVPFDRRFYSGGAASVRGWRLRELGPGAAPDSLAAGSNATNLLGGDVKLEANLELRQTLLQDVLGARWLGVLFADAGNVWFGPRNPGYARSSAGRFELSDAYREMGVGAGTGLRLAWQYIIARLDLAARVYDPVQAEDGLFPRGLRRPTLHFGLGHTF